MLTDKECRKICEIIKGFCAMNECNSTDCPFNYDQFGCILVDKLNTDIPPCDWEIQDA